MTNRNPDEVIALAAGKGIGEIEGYWWSPKVGIYPARSVHPPGMTWIPPIDYTHPDHRGALDEVIRGMEIGDRNRLYRVLISEWEPNLRERQFREFGRWLLFECPQTTLRDAVADVLGGA